MRARTSTLIVVLLLTGGMSFPGCGGGDGDVVQGMPGGGGTPAAAPAPARTPAPARPSAREGGQPTGPQENGVVVQRDLPMITRDPFVRAYPQANATDPGESLSLGGSEDAPVNLSDLGPLASYAVTELRLIGVVTRSARPVAMFQLPDSDLAVFGSIGDRVGPFASGQITDIQPRFVWIAYQLDPDQPETMTRLSLRDEADAVDIDFELEER